MNFFVEALLVAQFVDQLKAGDDDHFAAGKFQLVDGAVIVGKVHKIGNGRFGADFKGVAG